MAGQSGHKILNTIEGGINSLNLVVDMLDSDAHLCCHGQLAQQTLAERHVDRLAVLDP